MNTPLIFNIGLTTNKGADLPPHTALNAIQRAGFSISASRIALGVWLGDVEPCLVAVCHWHGPEPLWPARVHGIAIECAQDCIAVDCGGAGQLIGPDAKGQTFDRALFHTFPRAGRVLSVVQLRALCTGSDAELKA
jgi:hypothetical protein